MNAKISIAIVDDHTLFRMGLSSILRESVAIDVLFEAENGRELQQKVRDNVPDVVLMDVNMPVMDGYEATSWLKGNYPDVKVLALSMYEDDNSIIKMIRCGAAGYVLKQSRPGQLVNAIEMIYSSGFFFNELVSAGLRRNVLRDDSTSRLSDREKQFLQMACSELTYKEIADKMFVSPRTVDNYREALFEKLGIKSRVGLVLYAIKNNFYKII